MEVGQGKIDPSFPKSPGQKKSNLESQTRSPGIIIINIEPNIEWEKKPLPPKVPEGNHGGIAFRKFQTKIKDRNNIERTYENHEIFVPDIGFGTGGVVLSGAGPVLLGGGFIGPLSPICLPWIAILLLVTAVIWSVRHILLCLYKRRQTSRYSTEFKTNWVEEAIDQDQKSLSRGSSQRNGKVPLLQTQAIIQRSIESTLDPIMASVSSKYSNSIVNSLSMKSTKNNTLKGASTASILSDSSTVFGSIIYAIPTWRNNQWVARTNQMVVYQEKGIIFTVSENNHPKAYSGENITGLEICSPSKYKECVEVFLLNHETLLVGKMKTGSEYFVQAWSTSTGEMDIGAITPIPCLSVCPIRDEYLVILDATNILVLHLSTNTWVAQTPSPLASIHIDHRNISILPTKDGEYIVISAVTAHNVSLSAIIFDDLRESGLKITTKEFSASSFALISSCEIIIASTSPALISWDFVRNSESLVLETCDQDIQKIIASSSHEYILLQLTTGMSIIQMNTWQHVFDIPVSPNQVCSLIFSSPLHGPTLLAISLDCGVIKLWDCSNGKVTQAVHVDTPVTCLLVNEARQSLLTLSDRASHYLLKVFPLS